MFKQFLLLLALLCSLTACEAQKNILQLQSANHTNTGWHGAQQVDEKGNPVPTPPGFDVYSISFTALRDCRVEPIAIWVGEQYYLPLIIGNFYKDSVRFKKDDLISMNASAEKPIEQKVPAPKSTKGWAAQVLLKVNGKKVIFPIKNIQTIMPK
jgi:hypothetical protein